MTILKDLPKSRFFVSTLLKTSVITFISISSTQAGFFVGEGATSLPSLRIPTSARATSLSGAFGAVAGDVGVLEFNPAGLTNIDRTDIMASYSSYFEDSTLQSLSIGFPVRFGKSPFLDDRTDKNSFTTKQMGLGIQYRAFTAQDAERTTTGVKIGDFDVRDQVLTVGLAYPFGSRLSLGTSGKFIGSKIQDESATMLALDVGSQYKLSSKTSLGLAVQNLGSGKAYADLKDPLPTTLRGGVNYQWAPVLILLEVAEGRDEILKTSLGAEYGLGSYVKLRGGIANDTNVEFSGGLGVRFHGPQKAPVLTSPRRIINDDERDGMNEASFNLTAAENGLEELSKKIIGQYKTLEEATDMPSLALFPFRSPQTNLGVTFSDGLSAQLNKTKDFLLTRRPALESIYKERKWDYSKPLSSSDALGVAKELSCQLILTGSIEKIDDTYLVNARLLDVIGGQILVNTYQEFPENIRNAPEKKETLGKLPSPGPSRSAATGPNTDIGLDYGFTTQTELGVVHTLSLRVLY